MSKIKWNGDNLKEVISFIGLYKDGFEKWFNNSWDEYEKYVHEHGDTIKIFNPLGEHIMTAHVGDTIERMYSGMIFIYRDKPIRE